MWQKALLKIMWLVLVARDCRFWLSLMACGLRRVLQHQPNTQCPLCLIEQATGRHDSIAGEVLAGVRVGRLLAAVESSRAIWHAST